jgi:hypothetical protein
MGNIAIPLLLVVEDRSARPPLYEMNSPTKISTEGNMNSRKIHIALGFSFGGLLGVLLVRALFLDPFEQMGWTMFWEGLGRGEGMNWGVVLQSATFLKCLMGFVLVGAAAGVGVYRKQKQGLSTK